jgi:hypothetical protein
MPNKDITQSVCIGLMAGLGLGLLIECRSIENYVARHPEETYMYRERLERKKFLGFSLSGAATIIAIGECLEERKQRNKKRKG